MENLINVKCTDTTYLCNSRPNSNFYKEENLLIGAINNNFKNHNIFKSLLRFYVSDLNLDSVKNIYLYLFLENAYNTNNNATINISLSGSDADFDISGINWVTCPKKNTHTQINVNVPIQSNKKYIKIDISNIIMSLNSYTDLYNIILEPQNSNSSSMIQIGSNNSQNPPYLVLVNNSIDKKDSLYDFESDNNNNDENIYDDENENIDTNEKFDIEAFSTEIINELNTQNSRFDALEKNFSNLTNLTSESKELIETEINQLKNSVNYDISELQSYINNNISDLTNSIKSINETLLQLSTQVSILSKTLESAIITPLDDKSIQ